MKERLANLMVAAAGLQASGAIRPEHLAYFQSFRIAIEQAHAEAADPAPEPEPLVALRELRDQVQGLAVLLDVHGDKVDAIAEHLGVLEAEAEASPV